jgi:transposase
MLKTKGNTTMPLPDWVQKHKKTGHEIKQINNKYYLYKLKSKWNKTKKKPVKVSGNYLGTITPTGFKPKKTKTTPPQITTKEYGTSTYLTNLTKDIKTVLENTFEKDIAQKIYAMAILRVMGTTTFKHMDHTYQTSYLSEQIPKIALSPPTISTTITKLGTQRKDLEKAMLELSKSVTNIIVDGSKITSCSHQMSLAQVGYNTNHTWDSQVNVMYVFERSALPAPVFYRCVFGNIPDVSAMELTMHAMNRKGSFTVVGDAGFASTSNFEMLQASGMSYVIPLKRNTSEISSSEVSKRANFECVFTYNKRSVLAYESVKVGYRILVFRDEDLRSREMTVFVARLEKQNLVALKRGEVGVNVGQAVLEADAFFGVIVLRTNMTGSLQEVYETYKLRVAVEQYFDTLKNTLDQDRSYMHSDEAFEGWCFINHIALTIAYRVLNMLKSVKLTGKYSLHDVVTFLSRIMVVQLDGQWRMAEYTKYAKTLCEKIGLTISDPKTTLPTKNISP